MSISNLKVTPVYNISDYGKPLFLPITDVLTAQSVTLSSATITRSTDGSNFPIDDYPYVISAIDTVGLIHEGNNTVFDRIYTWNPDFTSKIYKMTLSFAMGINVSAYTSGNFNINNLIIIITDRITGKEIFRNTINSGAANQTAISFSYHIFNVDVNTPFDAYNNHPIDIRVQMSTTTGTGTRQEGMLTFFPFQAAAVSKIFTLSGILIYPHAAIDYGDAVFKDNLQRLKQ